MEKISTLALVMFFPRGSFVELFSWVHENYTVLDLECFVVICWRVWVERNRVVFHGNLPSSDEVMARAGRIITNFCLLSRDLHPYILPAVVTPKW